MLRAPLARLSEPVYAVFRIVFGALFAFHGAQKLFGLFGGRVVEMGTQPWVAGVIELAAGILIAVGLLAGLAAFVASGEMAAAYFIAHAPRANWPIQNQGELAALYCFAFLFIAARGAGMLSVDGARGAPRRR
ncbi:MAG: DoxX family protein [Vicinamibacterales bacterium]